MNKTAMLISATLTVLVILTIGALVYSRNPMQTAGAAAGDAATPAVSDLSTVNDPAVTATLDPQLEKIWMEREAAYQKIIAEANNRLSQLQQATAQPAVLPSAADALTTPITAEQAAAIAANYLGQTSVYAVSQVSIGGGIVYEVLFPSGDTVYVGLDGQIVGSASAPVFSSGGSGAGRGTLPSDRGKGSGGEHENDDDHDDHD